MLQKTLLIQPLEAFAGYPKVQRFGSNMALLKDMPAQTGCRAVHNLPTGLYYRRAIAPSRGEYTATQQRQHTEGERGGTQGRDRRMCNAARGTHTTKKRRQSAEIKAREGPQTPEGAVTEEEKKESGTTGGGDRVENRTGQKQLYVHRTEKSGR